MSETTDAAFARALISSGPMEHNPQRMQLFGRLVGSWSADVRLFDEKTQVWTESVNHWIFAYTLGGRAVQDVLVIRDDADPEGVKGRGTTIRVYDSALGAWRVSWFGAATGDFCTLVATPLGNLKMDVGNNTRPTVTAEYFLKDNLGLEVLAALPFQHDIDVVGVGKVGSTKHLPPTVSLQYHFNGKGKVSPFVGAGINYTTFFSEDTTGALAGSQLKLEDSWGLAAHAGVDFAVSEHGQLRVDLRWIDIDSKVRLDGQKIGTANIDPLVYGVAYVHRF